MSLFHRKKKDDDRMAVLARFDGREVSYVVRRLPEGEQVIGKRGRIVALDGKVRVMCGGQDVFRGSAETTVCAELMNLSGVLVEGENEVLGGADKIVAYYQYYRS